MAMTIQGEAKDPIEVVAGYSIPYDLDEMFWDDGCGGTDLVGDRLGENVTLLVSDTGSAYVCPEKWSDLRALWSIYMDPQGRSWRIEDYWEHSITAPMGDSHLYARYEYSDAFDEFGDILTCHESHGQWDTAIEALEERFTYGADIAAEPPYPSTLEGASVLLSHESFGRSGYSLSMRDGIVKIARSYSSLDRAFEDMSYVLDSGPLAALSSEVCSDHFGQMTRYSVTTAMGIAEACGEWPHLMRAVKLDDLEWIVAGLRAEIENTAVGDPKGTVLDVALEGFERAYQTAAEISVFRQTCYLQ